MTSSSQGLATATTCGVVVHVLAGSGARCHRHARNILNLTVRWQPVRKWVRTVN